MAVDNNQARTRRALLGGGLGAVAALVASAFGRAVPVSAADGSTVKIGQNNSGTHPTLLWATPVQGDAVFMVSTTTNGNGLSGGSEAGNGVRGWSISGNGVIGTSSHGYGVRAIANENYAVYGSSQGSYGVYGTSKFSYGVVGASDSGYGVYGTSQSNYAVSGLSIKSAGVAGFSDTGQGVIGSSNNVGVLGQAALGRGGRFSGGKAQIRLDPSTAATHPSSGLKGDLFVDASARLWFCKGGTSWVRLDD